MQDICTNCEEISYFNCRKCAAKYNDALNSRESTAEKLNISESSLRNYELGLSPVPVDVVVRMADMYGAPELEANYCREECPIGKHIGCAIGKRLKRIEQIACSLAAHTDEQELGEMMRTLMRIAADGKVDENEVPELKRVVEYMDAIFGDIKDLRLLAEKEAGCDGKD